MFTDDDLRQLKERQRVPGCKDIEAKTDALLARLKAAEECAELLQLHQESGNIFDGDEEDDALALQALEAWRKAAGK